MKHGNSLWLILLLLAGVIGGVGWWAEHSLRLTVQSELRNGLQATLDANVTALEIWMNNQKRLAAALADEPRLKSIALELFEHTSVTNANARAGDLPRQLLANDPVADRLRTLGYGMAQLVDTNFTIVADTGRGRGRNRPGGMVLTELRPRYEELFTRGEPVLITPFKVRPPQGIRPNLRDPNRPPRPNESPVGEPPPRGPTNRVPPRFRDMTVMQVAAPVKDNGGQTRGALALIMSPDAEFTRILSVARSGDSGETFAFDAEGLMISRSRFDEQLRQLKLLGDEPETTSALSLTLRDPGGDLTQGHGLQTNSTLPLITMVHRAIEGEAGVELTPFRDYRGVPVVGAWRWLPEFGFGVGTKIDARQAFESLRVVRRVFLILILMLVAAALVILVFSYKQLLWRRRLSEAELKARQLGQYKVSEKIGEGGMGVVYRAHHSLLRRETALKLLLPHKADPAAIERFEQEVQLTCRLTHPNTIQVYDYGHTPDGIFYYAMEYLDGLNLQQLIHHYGAQPEERVLYILRQISDSLSEAHEIGLIHRDIKPANIFLCDRGGVPDSVKVLDFGLVRHVSGSPDAPALTEVAGPDGIVGTPNFIAPESIRDPNQSDARSDVYSLGVLGYFLLTGREIFEGDSIAELCRQHLHETPVPPSVRAGRSFEPRFESLMLQCLEKDPAARPQSARQLSSALTESPRAGDWTPERRAAWWAAHRKSFAVRPGAVNPTPAEKTVKIAFADRTP